MINLQIILIFYIVIVGLCLLLKKNHSFLFYIGLILNWMIMSGTTLNADYYTYLQAYDMINSKAIINDIGWNFLMRIFNNFGFDYNSFLMIVIAFTMLIFAYSISKLTTNRLLFLIVYTMCFMFIDTIQIRNFVAFSIVLYAITILIKSKKSSDFLYLIFVLLASTIHVTSIFFVSLLFVKHKHITLNKYLILFVVLLISFFQINPAIRNQLMTVFALFGKEYDTSITVGFGYLYILVISIMSYVVLSFTNNQRNNDSKINYLGILCNNLTTLSFFVIPLCMVNMNAFRIIRYVQLLNILYISNNNFDFFNKNYTTLIKSNFNIRVGTLFTCSFLVYFIYFVFGTYEKIIQPILENNIFFGG